jgi:hypothetical protein
MSRPCSVCQHSEAAAIAQALAKNAPVRELQRRYGLTKSAINRHALHCVPVAVQLAQAATTAEPILHQVRDLNRRTLRILQAAERSGDGQLALSAIAQARKNLELCARLSGELTPNAGSDSGTLQVQINYVNAPQRGVAPSTPILDATPMLPDPE